MQIYLINYVIFNCLIFNTLFLKYLPLENRRYVPILSMYINVPSYFIFMNVHTRE